MASLYITPSNCCIKQLSGYSRVYHFPGVPALAATGVRRCMRIRRLPMVSPTIRATSSTGLARKKLDCCIVEGVTLQTGYLRSFSTFCIMEITSLTCGACAGCSFCFFDKSIGAETHTCVRINNWPSENAVQLHPFGQANRLALGLDNLPSRKPRLAQRSTGSVGHTV